MFRRLRACWHVELGGESHRVRGIGIRDSGSHNLATWDPLYLQFYGLYLLTKGNYYETVGKSSPRRLPGLGGWTFCHVAFRPVLGLLGVKRGLSKNPQTPIVPSFINKDP